MYPATKKIGMCMACGDGYCRKTILYDGQELCLSCASQLGLDSDDDQSDDDDDEATP